MRWQGWHWGAFGGSGNEGGTATLKRGHACRELQLASANALHNAAPDDCSAARVSICFPGHPRPAGWCDLSARPPQQVDRLQPRTYSTRISCPRAIASSGSDEATDHALHVESKGASMGTKELFAPWRATLPGLKSRSGMNWKCWNYPAAAATQHNARTHSGPPST